MKNEIKNLYQNYIFNESKIDVYVLNSVTHLLERATKDKKLKSYEYNESKIINNLIDLGYVIDMVYIGGNQGGSYHEDSVVTYEKEEYKEIRDNLLEYLIDHLSPDISHKKYKEIREKVFKEELYTRNEYYGNSYDYKLSIVDIDKLIYELEYKNENEIETQLVRNKNKL